MGTMVIFGGPALIVLKLTLLGLFYDAIFIALERKKPDDQVEEESGVK